MLLIILQSSIIAALFILLFTRTLSWNHQPILRLDLENKPPWVRGAFLLNGECDSIWIRCRLTNWGCSAAINCRPVIEVFSDATSERPAEYFDPIPLAWAGSKDPREAFVSITVRSGETKFIDVACVSKLSRKICIQTDRTPKGFPVEFDKSGSYAGSISVYADNAEAIRIRFRFSWHSDDNRWKIFSDLKSTPQISNIRRFLDSLRIKRPKQEPVSDF